MTGDRLPTQCLLAAQLDVDLTTIMRAYGAARRRNLLEGRGARGTYVAAPKVASASILDLSMNTPPSPDGVDFDDTLKQGLSQVLMMSDNESLMAYHLAGGGDSGRKAEPNGSNSSNSCLYASAGRMVPGQLPHERPQ